MLINTPATATATVEERREPGWDHREWRVGGLPPPRINPAVRSVGCVLKKQNKVGFRRAANISPASRRPCTWFSFVLPFFFFF